MNRSDSEKPEISPPPALGSDGPMAAMPSTLVTKLATIVGRSGRNATERPPSHLAARSGGSKPPRDSASTAELPAEASQSDSRDNPSLLPANALPN